MTASALLKTAKDMAKRGCGDTFIICRTNEDVLKILRADNITRVKVTGVRSKCIRIIGDPYCCLNWHEDTDYSKLPKGRVFYFGMIKKAIL